MKLAVLLAGSLALGMLGCGESGELDGRSAQGPLWDVEVYGALRPMMHEGQTGVMVTLDRLLPNENLHAVGALAELAGEITVIGGEAYLSYPEGEEARTEAAPASDAEATLLVYAIVPEWQAVVTERDIPFDELDDRIGALATAAGLSLDERLPFLVEGEVRELRWHVIDGRKLSGQSSTHRDHLEAAVQLERDRSTARLVGFYSKSDQGVFTHMGSKTHVHCVVEDPLSAGHVDHVVIPMGATIRFPAIGR